MTEEKSWLDNLASLNNGEISEITTNITTKEEFDKLEEQLKSERDEMRRASLEASLENEENNENSENDEDSESSDTEASEEEMSIDEQMELIEKILGSEYLVRGALLRCNCGTHERKLNVLKDHGIYLYDKPIIHQLDKENEENVTYFGICNSGSKYLKTENVILEIDIKDENGQVIDVTKVSGKRCEPYIMSEWLDTKKDVRIVDNGDKDPSDKLKDGNDTDKGYPAVTMNSFLVCRHGGLIEPLTSGQEYEEEIGEVESEIEVEATTEIQDPGRDKEVLSKLLDKEGIGIDLINDTKAYIEKMKNMINEKNLLEEIDEYLKRGLLSYEKNTFALEQEVLTYHFYNIMSDFYRAQQSNQLDNLTYEETREIAKLVNEYVEIIGVNETVHYFRNVMNDLSKAPEDLNSMLEEVREGKWKLLSVGESVYHKQGGGNNIYNLKFVSIDNDEQGNELEYGYFEAVYSLDNPNEEYSLENLPKGTLLDRDTDPINMGTYNYGGNGVTHSIMDVVPYNSSGKFGYGNVGENAGFAIPKDYKVFKDNIFSGEIATTISNYIDIQNIFKVDKEMMDKINLSQENITNFIEGEQ